MPFTPCVPVTPRLVTKKERKQMKKEQGRGVTREMVASEDDMWDASY
jgi:hypothetical protein